MDMFGGPSLVWLVNFRQRVLDWTSNNFFVEADERCGFLFTLVNMPGKQSSNPTILQHMCTDQAATSLLKISQVPKTFLSFTGRKKGIHWTASHTQLLWPHLPMLGTARGQRRPSTVFSHDGSTKLMDVFMQSETKELIYSIYIYTYIYRHIYTYIPINYNPKL